MPRITTEAERDGHPPGYVGIGNRGHFVHYCRCGKWGAFGFGHFPKTGRLGTWYCLEHRPPQQTGEAR